MKKKIEGFTLVEVLIAMFVIVVGVAGVTATIWWAMQKQDSGKLMTEASDHARVIFERIQARSTALLDTAPWPDSDSGLVDDPDVRRPLYDPPFDGLDTHLHGQSLVPGLSGSQVGDIDSTTDESARFTRNIRCTRMVPTNPPADDFLAEMAQVQVRVFWQEKKHERSVVLEGLVTHAVP